MATVVRMPEVLAGVSEAAIATWLVALGDRVDVGTPLAEIETEKAVVEYASEVEGTVLELLAAEGAGIAIGAPIVVVGAPGESFGAPGESVDAPSSSESADSAPAQESPAGGEPAAFAPESASAERRFVSPLVRRLARERRIDLSSVDGSGPNGRVVRRDLEARADVPLAPVEGQRDAPTVGAAAVSRDVEEIAVTPMRRAIARRLTESATTVPHIFLVADCRVDRLVQLRAEANDGSAARVSINDFVIKAVAGSLRAVPDANATWGDTVIRRHRSVDIAVAVAVEGGLVAPVIRDADRLSLGDISRSAADLAGRAREGRLRQHELEGGTFSVSNLGMYGTQEFSAIINPPHAGILAVGAVRQAPVVEDGAIVVGSVMTITLSADHRVMDGVLAAQLLAAIVERIEHPLRALI